MHHPCIDYHMGVTHAPHDWTLGDTSLECPGKFDEGGTSALSAAVVTSPDAGSGSMALTREEHVELEQATGRVLAVA